MSTALNEALKNDIKAVDEYLNILLSDKDADYSELVDSMRYSLFAGGKRVRPFLTLEFAKLFGAEKYSALPYACAVELIHTYSLIHDDLPCMDNDDLRRGKPTNHKVFGECTALLAGDALLTYSFGCAVKAKCGDDRNCIALSLLSECAGYNGMVGGQQMDIIGESKSYDLDMLIKTHSLKTGKLITCACLLGAVCAGFFEGSAQYDAALEYSRGLGLAFQITDDILDAYGNEQTVGKSIGSDAQSNKSTFLTLMTKDAASEYAKKITEKAKAAVKGFYGSDILVEFADSMLSRVK